MVRKPKPKKPPAVRDQAEVNEAPNDCAAACGAAVQALEEFARNVEALTVDEGGARCITTFAAAPRLTYCYQRAWAALHQLDDRLRDLYGTRERFSKGKVIERSEMKYGKGGAPLILGSALQGLKFALVWPPTVPGFIEKGGREVLAPRFRFGDRIEARDWSAIRAGIRAIKLHVEEAHGGKEQPASSGLEIGHGGDFTWLKVGSKRYAFVKGMQVETIKALFEEWLKGGDGAGLAEETIGEKVRSSAARFRVQATFHKHPALGTILRPCGKGQYALFLSEELRKEAE